MMDSRWITIVIAGIFEVVWAVAMDYSDGFRIWYYDVIVVVFLILSMVLLAKSLKSGLPVGTAYAVWTGIGAVGTLVVSTLLGNETMTVLKAVFLVMIIAGIIGLQVTSGTKDEPKEE
jgi:quaternary ammonium compound-resistance protein SugE